MFRRHRGSPGRPAELAPSAVVISSTGPTITIAVNGALDGSAGAQLVEATRAVVCRGPQRLDVDLRAVAAFTADGAASLLACRDLGAALPEGVHYRTGGGPGCDALLAAYGSGDGLVIDDEVI
ncbi:hypothetical protein BH18ACT4_BH18ACT4_01620 [soil metagenome]